jgi:hypothetical protein
MAQRTITIPDDLDEIVQRHKKRINVSKVCQIALRDAIQEVADNDVDRALARLTFEKELVLAGKKLGGVDFGMRDMAAINTAELEKFEAQPLLHEAAQCGRRWAIEEAPFPLLVNIVDLESPYEQVVFEERVVRTRTFDGGREPETAEETNQGSMDVLEPEQAFYKKAIDRCLAKAAIVPTGAVSSQQLGWAFHDGVKSLWNEVKDSLANKEE